MDNNTGLGLSQGEVIHQTLMKSIAEKMADTPYVLKGGTALLFARGLDRHSTDLDFDAPKALSLERKIKDSFKENNIKITSLSLRKNTAEKQRYMVHYNSPQSGIDTLLKIETGVSLKPNQEDIEIVNGIQTYKLPVAFDQKMNAFGDRDSVRDIYDINFILKKYPSKLSDEQILKVDIAFKDMDGIAKSYSVDHGKDTILRGQPLDSMILDIRFTIDAEIQRRGLCRL